MTERNLANPAAAKVVISVFAIGIGLSALIAIVGAKAARHTADSSPTPFSRSPLSGTPLSFANLKRALPADQWRSAYGEAETARRQGESEASRGYPAPPAGTALPPDFNEKLAESRATLSEKYIARVRAKYHLTEAEMSALIIWGKTDPRTHPE